MRRAPEFHPLGLIAAYLLCFFARAGEGPEVPRIDCVHPAEKQPWTSDPDTIWYDSFDGDESTQQKYFEYTSGTPGAKRSATVFLGKGGQAMECFYPKGSKGLGGRKLVFGDCPIGPAVKKGRKFEEVYWRIYVKHQKGWTGGGPAKMSRATSFTAGNWTQAMIAHVWSSGEGLTLDPASGVKGGAVVTTKYNDFGLLKWLGNRPPSPFKISATEESGRWVMVESRAKLNALGQSDGINQLWIDGLLQCERRNLNWRGTYDEKGINAVFLEAYWNNGSPVDQHRWYDDFVVSTKPIGPLVAPANPTLQKTPFFGAAGTKQAAWEAEVAVRLEAQKEGAVRIFERKEDHGAPVGEDAWGEVVWKSRSVEGEGLAVAVNATSGAFSGPSAGKTALEGGRTHFVRCRQKDSAGNWSEWSSWHQAFMTERP